MIKIRSRTFQKYYGKETSEYELIFIHYNIQPEKLGLIERIRINRDFKAVEIAMKGEPVFYFSDQKSLYSLIRIIDKRYKNAIYLRIRSVDEYTNCKRLAPEANYVVFIDDLYGLPPIKEKVILQIDNVTELPLEKLQSLQKRYNITKILLGQISYLEEKNAQLFETMGKMFPWAAGNQKALELNNKITEDMYDIDNYCNIVEQLELMAAPCVEIEKGEAVDYLAQLLSKTMVYDINDTPKNINPRNHNLNGFIFDRKCVCEGISKVMYQLCSMIQVQSKIVVGYKNNSGHVWNRVNIDNTEKDVDITEYYYQSLALKQ